MRLNSVMGFATDGIEIGEILVGIEEGCNVLVDLDWQSLEGSFP